MYLIFTEPLDYPTNFALKWFSYYRKDVLCINKDTALKVKIDDLNNPTFIFGNKKIKLCEIEGVWFRRSTLKIQYQAFYKSDLIDRNLKIYHQKVKEEVEEYLNYLLFKKLNSIGNPLCINVNKLTILSMAEEVGLLTPKTFMASSDEIEILKKFDNEIITKLVFPLPPMIEGKQLRSLTTRFNINEFIDTDFALSLFQKRIDKNFEIRIFYLKGTLFAKAIFSQNDPTTVEDYRNYNHEKPNRVVPFEVPEKICKKLKKLMQRAGLDTGSIDMIVDQDNNFLFLEVNPVGQFSEFYFQCNYPLEREIVKELI